MTEREAFEAFCKNTGRHPDDMKMAIWQAACAWQREQDLRIIESHRVPVGNSAAGEMAAEWTMDALKDVRDKIRSGA